MRTGSSWLVTWVGRTDHEAAEGHQTAGLGPVATALNQRQFDRVVLLTNYGSTTTEPYRQWLLQRTGCTEERIELRAITLKSPTNYASIYTEVCTDLSEIGLPRDDVALTFHLSPGTPAMTAIWIMLAKTRFPAQLIQTSREHGLESVDFDFNLADDFLPEYLQRSTLRIERLANAKPIRPEFAKIVHRSQVMRQQIDAAQRVAGFDVPVLILGETGTGKELFAEAIHAASPRKHAPFVAINCGALSPELASSELFGHVKGAFTGATSARKGHFRSAEGGTLFLDEIGDLPADTQVRLLRALQSKEVTPVGASKSEPINVRILAATHRDLMTDVASGRFREDLFHRLAVGILRLPPLRDRPGDVEMLLDEFLQQFNREAADRPEGEQKELTPQARQTLLRHAWPGNVRELYHTLLRAAIWSRGPQIQAEDVHAAVLHVKPTNQSVLDRPIAGGFSLPALLDEISRHYLRRALNQTARRKEAAYLLGLNTQQTLTDWLRRLGMDEEIQKKTQNSGNSEFLTRNKNTSH